MAIVPVRGITGSKSRLASIFSARERMELVWSMAGSLIEAMPPHVVPVVITKSPDDVRDRLPQVRIVAQDAGSIGLNGALAQGLALAKQEAMADVLVISADLPLVTQPEIQRMLDQDGGIVIAGDSGQTGTNGIRLPSALAGRFRFHFGSTSFRDHLAEAQSLGIRPVTVYERGLAHDLDTPDDWITLPLQTREDLTERMRASQIGV